MSWARPANGSGLWNGKKTPRWWVLAMFLFSAFLFRFFFGLYCPSVVEDDDEVQTYLIGLKSYTTQTWPTFGTDLQGGTVEKGQMPGALEGLLIRIPLEIWHAPEAPYLFLNVLTFAAFTFLGWYCCRRLPGFSPGFVFVWLYIAPWDTHFSTVMMNQSFSIVGAILFWVGFLESFPRTGIGFLPVSWANALMGFGLFWVFQLHMSWVMFAPFLLVSFYFQWKAGTWKEALGYGFLGALPMLALLAPTYYHYGIQLGRDIHGNASSFNQSNLSQPLVLLARYFSLACFELPRFIGEHTRERLAYLTNSPWLLPAGFFLWAAGILQALAMLFFLFRQKHSRSDWKAVKWVTVGLAAILYLEFLFSRKPPSVHRYYEALPLAMIFSFYCWDIPARSLFWRKFAVVFLLLAFYFQVGYAVKTAQSGISVYSQYHEKMSRAIEAKDYRLLAERRGAAIY